MTVGPVNVAAVTPTVRFTSADIYGTGSPTTGSTFYELSFYAWLTSIINSESIVAGGGLTSSSGFNLAWPQTGFICSGYYCQLIAGSTVLTGTSANAVYFFYAQLTFDPILLTVNGIQIGIQSSTVPPANGKIIGFININGGNTAISSCGVNQEGTTRTTILPGGTVGQQQFRNSHDTQDPGTYNIAVFNGSYVGTAYNAGWSSTGPYQINSSVSSVNTIAIPVSNVSNAAFWTMNFWGNGAMRTMMQAWCGGAGWTSQTTCSLANSQNTTTWQTTSDRRTKIVNGDVGSTLDLVRLIDYKSYRHNGLYGTPLDPIEKERWGLIADDVMEYMDDAIGTREEIVTLEDGEHQVVEIDTLDVDKIQAAINNAVTELIWLTDRLDERIDKLEGWMSDTRGI